MKEKFDVKEFVKVETLPHIISKLEKVGEILDGELENVNNQLAMFEKLSLKEQEEAKSEVKKVRTNINNTLKEFEDARKNIKNQILQEYYRFNDKYETEVKTKLEKASENLKIQIDKIENKQLLEKKQQLVDFVNEYIEFHHLNNIINYELVEHFAGLKVNISTSLKTLQDNSKNFIERVANEVKLIDLEEQSSALLYEYQNNGYDLTKAKLTLIERQKQIEELAKQRNGVLEQVKEETKVEEQIEQILTTPKEIIEEKQEIECTFTIKTTMGKLKALKQYLKDNSIEIMK